MRFTLLFLLVGFWGLGMVSAQEKVKPEKIEPGTVSYAEIGNYSWPDVFSICSRHYSAPVTANYPIQAAHSPDMIYVNGAMGILPLRAIPDADHSFFTALESREGIAIQPLFGEFPVIPAIEQTSLEVREDRLPLIREKYQLGNVLYTADYCSLVAEGGTVVALKISAKNLGNQPENAVVWLKPSIHQLGGHSEGDALLTFHYHTFFCDKNHLFPAEGTLLENNDLYYYGARFGTVNADSFEVSWPDPLSFSEDEKTKWCEENQIDYQEPLMPDELSDVIRLAAELGPDETCSLEFKFLPDYRAPRHPYLLDKSYAELEDSAIKDFLATEEAGTTTLKFEHDKWGGIFNSLHKQVSQMTLQFPGRSGLVPTQGSNSQYHYVWMWEAMFMMKPLVRTGHNEEVQKVLEYLFTFQDRFPPQGRFHSLDGAIGSNAIRWANSTGCALFLAADYYRYSLDSEFLDRHLTTIERAAQWILGEIQATRQLREDGTRPANYGIMPFARGCDGTVGYNLTLTDGYTWAGLDRTTKLLQQIHHPDSDLFRKETDQYRSDILAALPAVTDDRGFIRHQLETGEDGEVISYEFEPSDGIHQLVYSGVVSPDSDWFRKYLDIYEQEMTRDCFFSPFDKHQMYLGTGELDAQLIYYRTGQWKKAFLAVQAILLYGKTEETNLLMERYGLGNPRYLPFQPNGSQTGRLLEMMLNSIVFEWPDDSGNVSLTLLPGIPWQWLLESPNGLTLNDLRLAGGGHLSLTVKPSSDSRPEQAAQQDKAAQQELTVTMTGPNLPSQFQIPDMFQVVQSSDNLKEQKDGWYHRTDSNNSDNSDDSVTLTFILSQGKP